MSSEDVTTEDFAKLTPNDRTEAAEEGAKEASSRIPDMGKLPTGRLKGLAEKLVSGGDGVTVEYVTEEYGCKEGTAYMVRGITRTFDIDDVPPIADIVVGFYKNFGARSNQPTAEETEVSDGE